LKESVVPGPATDKDYKFDRPRHLRRQGVPQGRDNLRENVAGIMGFHTRGFARDMINMSDG
jgi:hypothetical protein